MAADDKTLLKEIVDQFKYYTDQWADIIAQGRQDMRYVAGDPWDPQERSARESLGRPCMSWDELSPYINDLVNDVRQNPRSIKLNPKGMGASDQTAQLRENIIRDIQYNSRAQAAFTTGYQGAVERSYGYWGVGTRFVTDYLDEEALEKVIASEPAKLYEKELYIRRIPNPDSVLFDPSCKDADCSDAVGCFITDRMRRTDFKRKYPNADTGNWNSDYALTAPGWQYENEVVVGEYWKVKIDSRMLYLVGDKNKPVALYASELPKGFDKSKILHERKVEKRSVTQYITNGVEILDETEIPISIIPIVPVFGKELYVDEGGGTKRRLISLVRMARDPQMFYCFLRSQEAEEASMTPKSPFIGYTGQFETHKDQWQNANKIPVAYLQVDPTLDATGQATLPLPTRQPFQPNFQSYEIAAEAARRAIQTAMSGSNLPTAAQRQNQKSGVALKEIDRQEAAGTFHFLDNYNAGIEKTGRILDEWMPFVYDTARDIAIREEDETHRSIRINDPQFEETDKETGQPKKVEYNPTIGDHGVTVSVGMNFDSQREEANDFVQTVVTGIAEFAQLLPPGAGAKILALAIKLKGLGPIGDEMADVISPPPDQQKQQQMMAQGQQQLQQNQQVIAELQAELQKMKLEKAGRVIDNQFKAASAELDRKMDLLIALIKDGNKATLAENAQELDLFSEVHGAAHEAGMQAADHAHEKAQADSAQQAAALQQGSAQAADAQAAQVSSSASGDANSPQGAQ